MHILVVEDEVALCDTIVRSLKRLAYSVDYCYDGQKALDMLSVESFDLVVLDLNLPNVDGMTVLKTLRQTDIDTKVLILSARCEVADKVLGLDEGANDYLTKPFQSAVLIARIEAHLRRHHKHFLDEIKFEDVMMNTKNREVTIDDHVIVLTKVEYDLLKMFMEHPKEAVSRETLLQSIWGFQYDGDTRIVDVHVFKLKGKLKESRVSFKSVRGVGYKLVKKDD